MLSEADNELLTRVGPGTPMGTLLRRFWMPALVTDEIAEADGTPVRLRIMGEDLVAFRDSDGRTGILGARCPHRLAGLYWGRNEECGLRCLYHGWKFDVDGNCVDMPSEPPTSKFKEKIKQLAYPTHEAGGVVWVYMGPRDLMPERPPALEWVTAPAENRVVSKYLQRSNWAQAMEGEVDSAHISFLHSTRNLPAAPGAPPALQLLNDGAPRMVVQEEPQGFSYGARRGPDAEGHYYWRVTRWLYPFYSLIPGGILQPEHIGGSGRAWVPIDDEHTYTFAYNVKEQPYTAEERADELSNGVFPPKMHRGTYRLPDGYVLDVWLPDADAGNDYEMDRGRQRNVNFSGMRPGNDEDRAIQESMGRIVDRGREHLGSSDVATVAARRLLLKMARALQQGHEPAIAHDPDAYRLRAMGLVSTHASYEDLMTDFHQDRGLARL